MRVCFFVVAVLFCGAVNATSARWDGIRLLNGEWYSNGSREYLFYANIHGENGEIAWIFSSIYGHIENGNLSLKHVDFSQESMEPTFNWWALALYGDVVSEVTFDSFVRIEDFYNSDPNAPYTGGTKIENPSDFYMVFKASEVLLEDREYVAGQSWYGWVHVSIDENLDMTLLEDGINLDGGPVVVGGGDFAIPEPSSALLLLVGGAMLALMRGKVV